MYLSFNKTWHIRYFISCLMNTEALQSDQAAVWSKARLSDMLKDTASFLDRCLINSGSDRMIYPLQDFS